MYVWLVWEVQRCSNRHSPNSEIQSLISERAQLCWCSIEISDTYILLIALAFENCVDLAHAPLAFLYSDFVWGLCGSKVTRNMHC